MGILTNLGEIWRELGRTMIEDLTKYYSAGIP